ncbi:DUF2815 family protein [Holdemania massiliensis]|uniref:DUF2815 family protein n=1 Tax=Holdemania massiliensis TaxID=1468449 RepID=UPI0036F36988
MALKETTISTGIVRLSYEHLWEPAAIEEGQEKKYSASFIIPKSDKKTIAKIKKAIELAKENGKTSKWGGVIPKNLKMPLRDGDEERPDDPAYEDAYFINANCSIGHPPFIVDSGKHPISMRSEVYSGCFGNASVTFYPFNAAGNKGVACGLNGFMFRRDGEKLANSISADEAFADIEVDDDDDDLFD